MKRIIIILTAMFLMAPLYAKATQIEEATENWLKSDSNSNNDDESIDGDLRGFAGGKDPKGTLQYPVSDAYWIIVLATIGYGCRKKLRGKN